MDDSVVNRDVDVSCQLSKEGSAASEEEIDFDVYYGDLSSFIGQLTRDVNVSVDDRVVHGKTLLFGWTR